MFFYRQNWTRERNHRAEQKPHRGEGCQATDVHTTYRPPDVLSLFRESNGQLLLSMWFCTCASITVLVLVLPLLPLLLRHYVLYRHMLSTEKMTQRFGRSAQG